MGKSKNTSDEKLSKKQLRKIAEREAAAAAERKAAKKAAKAAKAEREAEREKTPEEIDAAIRARLDAKRAEGADKPGSPERLRAVQQDVADRQGVPGPAEVAEVKAAEAEQVDAEQAEAEQVDAEPAEQAAEPVDNPVENVAEAEGFAKPSEAPLVDFETNGNGQYKVVPPGRDRAIGYTRVTTYIDTLEDKSALTKWKMRVLLEGVAAAEAPDAEGRSEPVTARVRDLVHNRDLAIAKARKRDRKGKLASGQLATLVDGAWRDFKRELNALADSIFELGGGLEKAQKGTDLHALCELYDDKGIDAVQDLLDAGEITPADFADVEAYGAAIRAIGAKVIAMEQVIVHDDLKVAGRLDRVYLAKLPEIRNPKTGEVIRPADKRARRYVGDVKTGSIEYSAGRIAQQIRMYAEGVAYDLNTHERSSHGANRTTGLLIHLPAGAAKATVHIVDLTTGARGNKLSGEVRAFRNEGKRAYDTAIDLAQIAQDATEAGEAEA